MRAFSAPVTVLGLALAGVVTVAGCRPDDSFPSLSPRAIERPPPELPAAPPTAAANAALDAEAARLSGEAEEGARAFESEAAAAEPVIVAARGSAGDSEPWALAQQALARVEAAREPLTRTLATLDRLRIEQTAEGAHADTAALDAAWTHAQALQQKQIERYEALAAQVPAD